MSDNKNIEFDIRNIGFVNLEYEVIKRWGTRVMEKLTDEQIENLLRKYFRIDELKMSRYEREEQLVDILVKTQSPYKIYRYDPYMRDNKPFYHILNFMVSHSLILNKNDNNNPNVRKPNHSNTNNTNSLYYVNRENINNIIKMYELPFECIKKTC